MKDILVLGDSTSMTIGMEQRMYPYLMADNSCWQASTKIVNCSQPGFTAADACAFFFHYLRREKDPGGVIIHLGTCDAVSSEINKGRYNWRRQAFNLIKNTLGFKQKRISLKNRLLHFEWNTGFDAHIESPEKPEDFKYNVNRIVAYCRKKNIPVILIKPLSHIFFPPGVGKGNFVFYHYIGIRDKISHQINIPDNRFREALQAHEEYRYLTAEKLYKEILLNNAHGFSSPEYLLMVVNNYAVCAIESGNFDEGEYLFDLLLKEYGIRKEIILFNMAQTRAILGDWKGYQTLLWQSYEQDSFLYRIRSPYIKAIEDLYRKYSDHVYLLDNSNLVPDHMYIDHCHPLPEGQRIISENIVKMFSETAVKGAHKAIIENRLYNPELALGNYSEFYTYYRSYAPYTESQIEDFIKRLRMRIPERNGTTVSEKVNGKWLYDIPKEITTAMQYHLSHPCFPTIYDWLNASPRYPSDVGRFPEFFLVRHVIPYLKLHEQTDEIKVRFTESMGLLRKSQELTMVLPEKIQAAVEDLPYIGNADQEAMRVDGILRKVKQVLLRHTRQGNRVYERLKTTIFWFFRETLRFGPHSRHSMQYERVVLEYMAEALAIAGVIDLRLGGGKTDKIIQMIYLLEETARIHEAFCSKIIQGQDNSKLIAAYDEQLSKHAIQIDSV